jgi:hypothetical protein
MGSSIRKNRQHINLPAQGLILQKEIINTESCLQTMQRHLIDRWDYRGRAARTEETYSA